MGKEKEIKEIKKVSMRYIILCKTQKQCSKYQEELFEKSYTWASRNGKLLIFDEHYFPFYLIINDEVGHISWDEIQSVESDPAFIKEIRKLKIREIQNETY